MKKFLTCLLALVLVFTMVLPFASCKQPPVEEQTTTAAKGNEETTEGTEEIVRDVVEFTGNYTYEDAVVQLSANWNTHTYQTTDESYPVSFLTTGLYGFFFNDEDVYVSATGKDAYAGYVIAPEMAAEMPIDVTEAVKAAHPEFNIPSDATSGYAYEIKLNPNATWENGEKINADTYIYSMKQLLDPQLQNYRGPDYFDGDFCIANAKNYYYQGTINYTDNGVGNKYGIADLVKGEDGNYYTKDGHPMYVAVAYALDWTGGNSLKDYVDAYGEAYFGLADWDKLVAAMDEEGMAPLNDETYAWLLTTVTTNPAWGETDADAFNYFLEKVEYVDNYDFANVGLYKNDEYSITLVLGKSLAGFTLLYNLTGNWIVYEPYYEASKSQVGDTDAWTTSYCSTVENTMSYGPYKLVAYQMDKEMTFEKNEKWFGYTDGKHIYKDPVDGLYYPMYQTTKIHCQVVAEAATRKQMFLKGQLMGYGLQSEDFTEYRNSDYAHVTPSETIFFFIFNGYLEAIQNREANEGFDQTKYDLETMTINSFRRAFAVTYDREAFASTISPSRSGGYGIIGSNYIYDPESGAKYRDSDQAKKALCEFYSVDLDKFGGDLDKAVDSITGYDPETAKALFTQAFAESIEAGYITDADGDGKSDQIVRIEYASSATSAFIQKTIEYLNEKLAEVLVGTPFEGKIEIYESAPYGNDWSNVIRAGMSDTVLGGWSGSALNPFSLTDLYVNPSKAYDANWFDPTGVEFAVNVNGEEITMNLKQWSDALNGTTVEKDGKQYNFGEGHADVETRLDILAKCETAILSTYDYIPMLQDGSIALLSQQVFYVVDEYNPIMGRGGISYMKYNYDDAEWAAYVASQPDGILKY